MRRSGDEPRKEMTELSPEARFRHVTEELERVCEIRDVHELSHLLDSSEESWQAMESHDGAEAVRADLDWYEQNNHRINLYHIAGQHAEGWDGEEMTTERGRHLLALKRRDLLLKQYAKMDDRAEASRVLAGVLSLKAIPEHSFETAIDTLARLGVDGAQVVEAYLSNRNAPLNRQLRAVLSMCRYGELSSAFIQRAQEVLSLSAKSSNPNELNGAIELCGVLGGVSGRSALDVIAESMRMLTPDQRQWLERDFISVKVALDPQAIASLEIMLEGRVWKSSSGIVFGSIQSTDEFPAYIERNREKLEQLAEALQRTNNAFGSEPVLYVDLVPDSTENFANEGWTQNAIYLSQALTEHPRVSTRTTIQGAIHEACERWESKGFVDAQMEQDYLQLLGTRYDTSVLDRFRLRHRYDIPSRAGHPWDGTREYMAEAGSILLADPNEQTKLFDAEKDAVALKSLNYVQELIRKHSTHIRQS